MDIYIVNMEREVLMSRNKELIKNTFIILIGKISTQLITFLLLPIYTNFLSTTEYGKVDLIITYISLFAPLISLQLEYAAFRYLLEARKKEEKKGEIICNTLLVLSIISVICIIIFIPIYFIINYRYAIHLIIILIITMFANMLLQFARGLGDNLNYSIASFITGVSNALISIFLVVFLKKGIIGILLAMVISNMLCVIYLFLRLKLYRVVFKYEFDKKLLKKLLKYSIPLIPNSICWWIISVSDRSVITWILGAASNGIYSIAAKFSGVIVTLYNIFNLSWTETVSLHINDSDANEYLSNTFNSIICFFACGCIALICIMPFAFNILIGENYIDAYKYIPFLILGSFFNIIMGMLSAIYIGKKKSSEMAKTSAWAAILNVIINLIFVKLIGIWAAVISTVISYLIVSLYRLCDVKKYVDLKVNQKNIVILLFLFIFTTCLYFVNYLYVNVLSLLIMLIISYFLNKDIIKNMYFKIKTKIDGRVVYDKK